MPDLAVRVLGRGAGGRSALDDGSAPLTGFFVATTGSNGAAGTEAAPWQTIKHALTQATAGTTIWVRAGTHSANCHQAGSTAWNTGSSWASPITIRAYPGETVNISAQVGNQPTVNPTDYYHVWRDINFTAVVNGTFYGTAGARYIRLQDCTVSNAMGGGQGVHQASADCGFWELLDCDIHHNGTTTNLDHGCYLSGSNNLIDGCLLRDNLAYGVTFYPQGSNNVLRNTKMYNNKYGVLFVNGSGNQAYNNLVYGCVSDAMGGQTQTNAEFYFNTCYNNGGTNGIILVTSTGGTIRNNIVYLSGVIAPGSATSDHNVTANPSFTNAGAGDFTLTSSSTNCIDQGQAVGAVTTDFTGATRGNPPDIGAYEYP